MDIVKTAEQRREVAKIIATIDPKLILRDPGVPCPEAENTINLERLRAMRDLTPADYHMGDPNRLGYIIYTSGTSGKPSAVMHAHRAILVGVLGCMAERLKTKLLDQEKLVDLVVGPDAYRDLPGLIARHKATLFAAAPGVFRQMLKGLDPVYLPHLRHGLSAGEKMAAAVRDAWNEATDTPVYEAFGMSECSTFISGSPNTPAPIPPV